MRKALVYSKRLEEAGLTRIQAEAHLEILEEIVEDEMATKADIQALDSKMTASLQALESKMTTSLQALDSKMTAGLQTLNSKIDAVVQNSDGKIESLRLEMKTLEHKMTVKLGVMLAGSTSLLAFLIKVT